MPDLSLDLADGPVPALHDGNDGALRTLLVGTFADPDRCDRQTLETLETLLRLLPADRAHHLRLEDGTLDPVGQAETQLAHDAVDVVLLDLNGPVAAVLSLVGRLRVAAGAGVVFIGILPWRTDRLARLYLSAVVDEVIDEPLQPGSVHRVVVEALRVGPGAPGIIFCPPRSVGSTTRH